MPCKNQLDLCDRWRGFIAHLLSGFDRLQGGMTFLEETFSLPEAIPKHRLYQKAAQAVLKALLAPAGSVIKGQMRSELELRQASGYADRPRDFEELIHSLDRELHTSRSRRNVCFGAGRPVRL